MTGARDEAAPGAEAKGGGTAQRAANERLAEFYAGALTAKEIADALEIQGIDLEIAVLRGLMQKRAKEQDVLLEVIEKSVATIVRAVVARYRISPKHTDDVAAAMVAAAEHLAEQFGFGLGEAEAV